ncbi:MAG: hypothetical protein NVSMB51_08190 [Solirubrobacteraceae bacterium]
MAGASGPSALLIGDGRLAEATARALKAGGAQVHRLRAPDDREIRAALDAEIDRVVVVSRFDHVSLRQALVVAHIRPSVSLLVTIFDRDVAAHLQASVENVRVLSMADIVAPAFAAPCLDPTLLCLGHTPAGWSGIRGVDGVPQTVPRSWSSPGGAQRLRANLAALLHPFDTSAQIMMGGLFGVLVVFVLETMLTTLFEHRSLADALYSVAKVTVTVGPSPAAEQGETWFKLFSAASMLLSLGFIAVLTAGLVNRLLEPRLTGIAGRAAVPRRDHVIVVGLGQVGLRLCGLLRELGIPVVVVEQNPEAKNVSRARDQGLPIVIGSGSSQRMLRRLSIDGARALAAVTSDEIENIAIAVAARGMRDDLHLTFRAGDGDLANETRSLFKVGVVRDVYSIAAAALAAAALGRDAREAFPYADAIHLVDRHGAITVFGPREDA